MFTAAERLLIRSHARDPGMTTRALAAGRTPRGGSSYDALAAAIPSGVAAILDLACGDGHLLALLRRRSPTARLLGVDLSEAELAIARGRRELDGAALLHARAQALPLADHCVDAVVSHLALMLMDDLDAVVAELARVVAPGGHLAFIVASDRPVVGAWPLLGRIVRAVGDAEGVTPLSLGDPRMGREDGIRAVFGGAFTALVCEELPLTLDGPLPAVWAALRSTYGVHALSEAGRAVVRDRFHAEACALASAEGTIPLVLPLRLVTAIRRPDDVRR